MRQELQDKLYEKYPNLFSNKDKSIQESCMAWGIECNDGWYDLLSSVCWRIFQHEKNITDRVRIRNENNKENDQSDLEYEPVKFDQIKEKFGGLRFYVQAATDEHYNYINFAESMSYRTCEVCGSPGKRYTDGWHQALCNVHAEEQGREEYGEEEIA